MNLSYFLIVFFKVGWWSYALVLNLPKILEICSLEDEQINEF